MFTGRWHSSFTWWVNRKDHQLNRNNVFRAAFLSPRQHQLRRSAPLPTGGHIRTDRWHGLDSMFALNMMRLGYAQPRCTGTRSQQVLRTPPHRPDHDLYGRKEILTWDDEDGFYYDVHTPVQPFFIAGAALHGGADSVAVEDARYGHPQDVPVCEPVNWFLDNRPELAELVSRRQEAGQAVTTAEPAACSGCCSADRVPIIGHGLSSEAPVCIHDQTVR
jgi:hypothetical protein